VIAFAFPDRFAKGSNSFLAATLFFAGSDVLLPPFFCCDVVFGGLNLIMRSLGLVVNNTALTFFASLAFLSFAEGCFWPGYGFSDAFWLGLVGFGVFNVLDFDGFGFFVFPAFNFFPEPFALLVFAVFIFFLGLFAFLAPRPLSTRVLSALPFVDKSTAACTGASPVLVF
jgi:hypothetical protein